MTLPDLSRVSPVVRDELIDALRSGTVPARGLDLVEDEPDGLKKRRSVLKWDQKKRKYVREVLGQTGVGAAVGVADRGKKRLRDESGQLVKEKANL